MLTIYIFIYIEHETFCFTISIKFSCFKTCLKVGIIITSNVMDSSPHN